MKNILHIAWRSIRQTVRDKLTFVFMLAMPIAFTFIFSLVFDGGGEAAARIDLPILDHDKNYASAALVTLLDSQGDLSVRMTSESEEELTTQVKDGKIDAALVIPAGYGASLKSGNPVQLIVLADTSSTEGMTGQSSLQTAARRVAESARLAEAASGGDEALFAAAFDTAMAGWKNPPLRVETWAKPDEVDDADTKKTITGQSAATHTAPGIMMQFSMAGLFTSALALVNERKNRTLQRLLTTRAARHEIIIGHFLHVFILCFTQLILLVTFGQLFFGIDYLAQPLATLVMVMATALFVGALGLFVGTFAKDNDQAILFSMIPMMVFSGLGGAWMPLEETGDAFRLIGHFTPVAWAMDGFKAVTQQGLGLSAVWVPALALLGYMALFLALGVWKFRRE